MRFQHYYEPSIEMRSQYAGNPVIGGSLDDIADELAALNDDCLRLYRALHEAINLPKGIVPDEADGFYDPSYYAKRKEGA